MIDRAARRKKSASGSERKRTVFTLVVLGAVAVGSMGLMLWRLLPQEQAVTPIGTVDGLEITREELLLYAEGHRAAVAKHFAEAYGVKAVQDFWSASFDGECPGEMVKERALADLKRTKTEQKCMLEQGILSDTGYDGFLQEFFEENRRRRETAPLLPATEDSRMRTDCILTPFMSIPRVAATTTTDSARKSRFSRCRRCPAMTWAPAPGCC